MPTMTDTKDNLKNAFAGESQANRKYTAFGRKADKDGFPNVARLFRAAAEAETIHALGHLAAMDGIGPTADNLKSAVQGETYEFTEMYPSFRHAAEEEGHSAAVTEIDQQIAESKEHAARFAETLAKAAKRFAALARVEERHAQHYRAQLDKISV